MNNYLQSGQTMTFTAPSGGVSSGVGVQIGQLFVVPVADAAEGEPFAGKTCGVVTLPKDTADALTEGALVYWDAAEDRITTTASGSLLIGCAASDALAADTTGDVRLNGIARADEA